MKFTNKIYIKANIVLATIFSMRALSFAGNTISDVPSSASELRTIQAETSLYTDTCDITQNLVFYEGSNVYLRVSQPKTNASYVFDKAETYIRLYNANVFGANVKFPYVSNFIPSTNVETNSTNIISVDATWWVFSWWVMTMPRTEIAWQIITKNMLRTVIFNNNGASLSYYYRRSSNNSVHNGTKIVIINSSLTPKTSCTNYYVGRCGDGTIDTAAWGIDIPGEWFKAWHTYSIDPTEVCDDWPLNGQPGKCKKDCTGLGWPAVNTGWATCTLSASAATIEAWQAVTITAGFTSGSNAIFSPSITTTPAFTYPTWNGTATDTPTTTTTYTMNIDWSTGLSGTSCSTTVTVTQPEPKFWCALTFSPSYAWTGQVVNVWWNVFNTTAFFWTYIYVTPALVWARPHRVNANQFNGVSSVMATHTWDYTFSMIVHNETEEAICTWVLHVIDTIPPCTLTTTTPTISVWQTAILQWWYTNGVLATITPNIAGMNFVYPNRSNTNIPVTPTETTTYTMNVQGVLWGSWVSCNTTVRVMQTWLTLDKQLVTNTQYHPNDIVTFKLNFANNSATTFHNVTITDYLPVSLEYVDSQIFGVLPPYGFGTWFMWGNASIEYSWFNLAPGQQGYVLIRGRFKWYQYANQTLNNSFATADEIVETVYSSALFYAYAPNANAITTKTSDKTIYFPGEDAKFTIAVTNNGPDAINNITITDNWPNTPCITPDTQRTSNMPLTMTNTSDPYQWTYNGTLAIGQTIYLYITGHISNNATCIGTYINNADISYRVNNVVQTWSAQAVSFTVSTTPTSTMNFEKRLVQYGNTPWSPVVFELLYRNNGTATITNFDIVDYRPGTLNFVSASPMPTIQTTTPWGKELHRFITTPLAPNGSGKIIINWTIQ